MKTRKHSGDIDSPGYWQDHRYAIIYNYAARISQITSDIWENTLHKSKADGSDGIGTDADREHTIGKLLKDLFHTSSKSNDGSAWKSFARMMQFEKR